MPEVVTVQESVPAGSVLLHIGPHKTGTTALQIALFDARKRMARDGVLFPSDVRHPRDAVRAAVGVKGVRGERAPSAKAWTDLVERVAGAADSTFVLSSEIFANAPTAAIRRVVADLGAERVVIAVTLRPLARILPSQWQQHLYNRMTMPYEKWLQNVLTEPGGTLAKVLAAPRPR
jgi:hypothetical protein